MNNVNQVQPCPHTYVERPDLLPCSHCGHYGCFTDDVFGSHWGEWERRIWCSSSHCRAQVRMIVTVEDVNNKLIRMWNRRYTPPGTVVGFPPGWKLNVAESQGVTLDDMRHNVRKLDIVNKGDASLYWVSEGDLDALRVLGLVAAHKNA